MGLLRRIFGPRAPSPEEPDPPAAGWDAIDAACARLYPGQEPRHLANPGVRWVFDLSGKANPLDGAHIFDGGAFWHYVGLGLSELYQKDERSDPGVSGLGYELTFRLIKDATESMPPTWPVDVMNGLGRPAMRGEIHFEPGHTIEIGSLGTNSDGSPSRYTGVVLCDDPGLPPIDTPHGAVRFLQIVPVDAATLTRARGGNGLAVIAELQATDPSLITDRR